MVQQARLLGRRAGRDRRRGGDADGTVPQRLLDRLAAVVRTSVSAIDRTGRPRRRRLAAVPRSWTDARTRPATSAPEVRQLPPRGDATALGSWLGCRWRAITADEPALPSAGVDPVAPGGSARPRSIARSPAATAPRRGSSSGGQRSVTLYGAWPVHGDAGRVVAAVLVSQSTFRILQRLYLVRLKMVKVVAVSRRLAVTFTIVGSAHHRAAAAAAARRRRGAGRSPRPPPARLPRHGAARRDRRAGARPRGADRPARTRTCGSPSASPPTSRTSCATRWPRSGPRPRRWRWPSGPRIGPASTPASPPTSPGSRR